MDASQNKDYVLVRLFIKSVSDKYAVMPYSPITIPEGASVKDMVALSRMLLQAQPGEWRSEQAGHPR